MKRQASVAILAIATAISCGSDSAPTNATAQPAATTTTTTPKPSPTPAPLGQGLACGAPVMPECGQVAGPPAGDPPGVWGCCTNKTKDGDTYPGMVYEAMATLRAEQPQPFDGVKVLDRVAYVAGVARILERDYKVCAKPGLPGDEVGIKVSNESSEQYDIYTSDGEIRYPGFQALCTPARF